MFVPVSDGSEVGRPGGVTSFLFLNETFSIWKRIIEDGPTIVK